MSPFEDLTWTCHVCGKERPDDRISVAHVDVPMKGGSVVTVNVRYCNDRQACYAGVEETSLVKSAREAFA
jgi:hypothetical protein